MLIWRSTTSRSTIAVTCDPQWSKADYHRRRSTARQIDDVFWLEEERVLSEDWVVRYKKSAAATPAAESSLGGLAKSGVVVRENQAGDIAIRYPAFSHVPGDIFDCGEDGDSSNVLCMREFSLFFLQQMNEY